MAELTLQVTDRELALLSRLGLALGYSGRRAPNEPTSTPASDVLERLLDNIDSGITRPGSWERPWLCQALGYDWLEQMEPDPGELFHDRFVLDGPTQCSACNLELDDEERQKRDAGGAFIGLCCVCEDRRDFAAAGVAAAAARAGRPLPCFMPEEAAPACAACSAGPCSLHTPQRGPAADLSTAELERRSASGRERHRPHGPLGGEGCLGCRQDQDFLCAACERWRCFCRGGDPEPIAVLSFCDECSDVYRERLAPQRSALLRALQARLVEAIPGDFILDVDQALWSLIRCGLRDDPRTPSSPPLSGQALRRRAFSLGRRALRRATTAQRLGLVLLAWPGMRHVFHARIGPWLDTLACAAWQHPARWRGAACWGWLRGLLTDLDAVLADPLLTKLPRAKALAWLRSVPAVPQTETCSAGMPLAVALQRLELEAPRSTGATSLLEHPVVRAALAIIKERVLLAPFENGNDDLAAEDGPSEAFDFDKLPPGFEPVSQNLALSWAQYMLHNTPRGYDVFKSHFGWEWARAGESVDAEVPEDLNKAAARRGAWLDYLRRRVVTTVQSLDASAGSTTVQSLDSSEGSDV